jgi:hypothetical protein
LAMLKEFTSGWIKNRESNWDVKRGQLLAEPRKACNLSRGHGSAEPCKAGRFDRGPSGFGSGHLVSYPLVEGPAGGEECKGGRCWCPGAGAMGYGFMCRETWWRDWSLALRGDLHLWRGGTGEDSLVGSGMVCWLDRRRHKLSGTCRFGWWTPKWASRGCVVWSWG